MFSRSVGSCFVGAVVSAALVLTGCSQSKPQSKAAGKTASTSAPGTSSAVSQTATSQPPTASASSASAVSPTATAAALAGFVPASVTFVSATAGFVLGAGPCPTGTCTMLVATANAGRTWSLVGSLPPTVGGDAPAVTKVRFANTHDGWVFAPQLWSTHDGGHTWRRVTLPGSEQRGVIDVDASAGQVYALRDRQLFRTPVSADSWTTVAGVSLGTDPKSIALHATSAWIVSAGALATTPDGAHWQSLPDPCARFGSPWVLAGVAPVTTTDVFLLCAGGAAAGSQSKKVLFSSDAGRHATATVTDPPFAGDAGEIAAATTAVVAVSARSGASWVYRSGDGGRTWRAVLQQGDGGVGYGDLGFTTSTQGVAIHGSPGGPAPGTLLITRDAGASWAQASF